MASVFKRSLLVARTIPSQLRQISTSTPTATMPAVVASWPQEKFDNYWLNKMTGATDGWELRKALTEMFDQDAIPDPKIVAEALRACRRINDYSLCVRFLEQLKSKCGNKKNRETIYPWLISEVRPVLDELGISTPEEMGYDKPEFFIPDPSYYWEKDWYKVYGFDKMEGYKHFA